MAEIRLGRYEIEHYDPPPVCIRCGAPSVVCKDHRFNWYPLWAFLVLGVIGAAMFTKRMTVPVPLCDRHKWHWGGRTAIVLLGLLAFIGLFIGGAVLANEDDDLAPYIFFPIGLLFLAWIVSAVVLAATTIRPREITDKSITLTGVSPDFIDALNEARRGERGEDEENDDRPRRRRRRDEEDEEDEDDRRSRRRRDEDDDGGYFDPDEKRPRKRLPPDAYEKGGDR